MNDDRNKEKQCVVCGKLFIPNSGSQIYCSKRCSYDANNKKRRDKYTHAYIDNKQCVICGKTFTPKIKTQICCSDKCKKENKRIKDILYRRKNSENNKIYMKKYYTDNINKIKEYKVKNVDKIKEYQKEYDKQYRIKNKDKILRKHKKYYYENQEARKKYSREYAKTHREKINNYISERKRTDFSFKMNLWCRDQLYRCLHSKKTKHTFDILGYTPDELKIHLKSQFKEGMSWDNHGTLWHIDHIKPLCSFNFINEDGTPNYDVIREANSLDNLQPLYVEENLSKGGKIN